MNRKTVFRRFIESIFGHASQHYGHDQILRAWLNYPSWLPMNVQIQHGWYSDVIAELDDHRGKIPVMFVWDERIRDLWKSTSRLPVHILGAPFMHYRRMNGITVRDDAVGTVVFPNHSSTNGVAEYDVDAFCRDLRALPEKLKPITVCLHHRDMERRGPEFTKRGFKAVTAGHGRQENFGFVRRFYEIMARHRYSCSNEVGSYAFYAVEMGMPFFIVGPQGHFLDLKRGGAIVDDGEFLISTRDLFRTSDYEITPQQREFVLSELGDSVHITPEALRRLLFARLVTREIWAYPIRFLGLGVKALTKLLRIR